MIIDQFGKTIKYLQIEEYIQKATKMIAKLPDDGLRIVKTKSPRESATDVT